MKYEEWWALSGGDETKRGTRLKLIDQAFREMDLATGELKKAKLNDLNKAVVAWQEGKRDLSIEKWEESRRANAIRKLARWIGEQYLELGLWEKAEEGWSNSHNCYAYAMKCPNPQGHGNNARPGLIAGQAYSGRPNPEWKKLLTDAVQADAAHIGATITVLPQTTPLPVPAALDSDHYLVALVGFPMGYHFMRRDEFKQLWSHKNGSTADVATVAFNAPLGRYVQIDNEVAVDMMTNTRHWEGVTVGMEFISYLIVPKAGIRVAGPS